MIYNKELNIIETERLKLRLVTPNDFPKVVEYCSDPELSKYMIYLPYPYTLEDAISWYNNQQESLKKDTMYTYGIELKETGEFIGVISLSNNQRNNNGEIGYWLGKKYWNKGYMSEATKAIIEFAFQIKNMHKVYARCFSENIASAKVMQKNGLTFEGSLKDHIYKDGKYHDLLIYGLINDNN